MKENWTTKGGSYFVLKGKAIKLVKKYLTSGSSIIDIGSGNGLFAEQASDYDITLSDTENFSSQTKFITIDSNTEWSTNQKFDAITAWCVVEHLENPSLFAREAFNHLKPGGFLFLSLPDTNQFKNRLHFLFTGEMYRYNYKNSHITIFTPTTFKKIFNQFKIVLHSAYPEKLFKDKTMYYVLQK